MGLHFLELKFIYLIDNQIIKYIFMLFYGF